MVSIASNPGKPDHFGRSDYITAMGRDLHGESELDPGDLEEFWRQIESLTGKKYDEQHRSKVGWSCSC